MQYLRVKNWEDFQHYKDRNPPWIKLHRGLLHDYDFICLQDASKMQLMLIWLLASQMDNRIPADEDFIKKQIGISGKLNLKELIDKGFLIDDSNMLADCKQSAMPETETETEKINNAREKITLNELSVYHIQDWLADKRNHGEYIHIDPAQVLDAFKNYCQSKGKVYKDYVAAYKNAFGWERFHPKHARHDPQQPHPKRKVL